MMTTVSSTSASTRQHRLSLPVRIALAAVVVAMIISFRYPMWSIYLDAPQYPEGIKMEIWYDNVGGDDPSVLQNVNLLNHYIGMKPIEPDAIPELRWMPYIVWGLIIVGAVCVISGSFRLLVTWAVLFTLLAAVGLYDFYLWEYDYGHNLDPEAPIKALDSYQPPLIGSKQLLNITATSLPDIGGVILIAGLTVIYLCIIWEWINRKKSYGVA
ncbi:hypothetical protein [Thermonema rossianum]|jgi:hypothetical protein|uniref:hypothetical protein n=1 Tax=Thermonema rossianum TaxID=55505 RepID=UPI000AD8B48F|nr:hypothetical protein [Thermonema rossianum]